MSHSHHDIHLERFTFGAGATPIVLIHGVVHSRRAWDGVLENLESTDGLNATVYAINLPGHGESPNPQVVDGEDLAETIIRQLADLFTDIADEHGSKPLLVGNSLGGYLAIELARRGHGRGALAFSPAGFFHNRADQLRTIYQFLALRGVARLLRPILPTMARFRVGRTLAMGMFSARPWAIPRDVVVRDSAGLLNNALIDQALSVDFPFSVDANLAEHDTPTPTRCVCGTWDLTLIRGWHQHHRVLPAAELATWPRVGHVTMFDAPKEVAEEIVEMATRLNRHGQ